MKSWIWEKWQMQPVDQPWCHHSWRLYRWPCTNHPPSLFKWSPTCDQLGDIKLFPNIPEWLLYRNTVCVYFVIKHIIYWENESSPIISSPYSSPMFFFVASYPFAPEKRWIFEVKVALLKNRALAALKLNSWQEARNSWQEGMICSKDTSKNERKWWWHDSFWRPDPCVYFCSPKGWCHVVQNILHRNWPWLLCRKEMDYDNCIDEGNCTYHCSVVLLGNDSNQDSRKSPLSKWYECIQYNSVS